MNTRTPGDLVQEALIPRVPLLKARKLSWVFAAPAPFFLIFSALLAQARGKTGILGPDADSTNATASNAALQKDLRKCVIKAGNYPITIHVTHRMAIGMGRP